MIRLAGRQLCSPPPRKRPVQAPHPETAQDPDDLAALLKLGRRIPFMPYRNAVHVLRNIGNEGALLKKRR
jgi:hypothetical protein